MLFSESKPITKIASKQQAHHEKTSLLCISYAYFFYTRCKENSVDLCTYFAVYSLEYNTTFLSIVHFKKGQIFPTEQCEHTGHEEVDKNFGEWRRMNVLCECTKISNKQKEWHDAIKPF
jgi:hypothetical protein